MQDLFKRLLERLKAWWNKTSKKDRVRLFIAVGVALVILIAAFSVLTRTQYAVLYRDMDPADAGEMVTLLEGMNVTVQTEGTGTILVPADQVSRLTMNLASQGYPKSGFTYDTFARGSGFGSTDYDKKMYAKFELQEQIVASLRQMNGIRGATVQIAQQDTTNLIFASEVSPTTASVVLTLESGVTLSPDQVSAVENLVASSVEKLAAENVFITDQYLNRLNRKSASDYSTAVSNHQMELNVRDDFVRSIMSLLGAIYGADNVRVAGNVTLDFDQHSTESQFFSPVVDDRGIEVSLREVIEKATGQSGAGGEPGVDTNGGAPLYPETTDQQVSNYSNVTREVNYEVNQVLDRIEHAQGKIKDLSFSIALNLNNLSDENNSSDAVKNLVAGVVGLDDTQYDRISVQFSKFDGVTQSAEELTAINARLEQAKLFDLIKVIALYLVIGLCVIFILRKLFGLFKAEPTEGEKLALDKIDEAGGEVNELGELVRLATGPGGEEITVTKSATRERVEEFVDKNPEAVANLVRNWLTEETKGSRRR